MLAGALRVIALIAFFATFSSYNENLWEFMGWFGAAYGVTYTKLYMAMMQQQPQTPDIFMKPKYPIGKSRVMLSSGSVIEGSANSLSTVFYNIRYAQPPVGVMRFSDPVEIDQPAFVDASVQKRIMCAQQCLPPFCEKSGDENTEDCLFLNVHLPSKSSGKNGDKLAVMLWIFGGGFTGGAGSDPLYDADELSNVTGTIIVTINYRVGWFGFVPFTKEGISGNQGIKDQRMAMKWVHENIEAFGGDPNKITIFGQSAGAQSVLFHLISAESSPYYQRAILQSTYPMSYQTESEWNTISDLLLTQFKVRFKCNLFSGLKNCLRKLPVEEYMTLGNFSSKAAKSLIGARMRYVPLDRESQAPLLLEPSSPMLDGSEFPTNPLQLLASGQFTTDKDIIIGHNNGEFNNFDYIGLTREDAEREAQSLLGEKLGSEALSAYERFQPPSGNDYGAIFGDMMTQGYYACYTRALARKLSTATSGNLFMYEFAHPFQVRDPTTDQLIRPKAQHAGELQYLFRNRFPGMELYQGTDDDYQIMKMLSDYWGSFVREGSPRSDQFSDWPQYQNNGQWNILKMERPDATIMNNLYDEECSFWDQSGLWKRS